MRPGLRFSAERPAFFFQRYDEARGMTDWFTTEAIDNDTFVISEYKHWEETHCYLLIGTESALLIDTGLGVSDIKDVVGRYTSLPVIVATTHVHWDHIGGHGLFDDIAVHAGGSSVAVPVSFVARSRDTKPDMPALCVSGRLRYRPLSGISGHTAPDSAGRTAD